MSVRLVPILFLVGCSRAPIETTAADASPPPAPSASLAAEPVVDAPAAAEPVSVDALAVSGDLDAYVLRGVKKHEHPMIFLGGMCVHPQGYVQSFAYSAVEHGVAIGLQGDVPCAGEPGMTRWSYDVDRTNKRIDAAFAAAGEPPVHDAIAIGLSQGADLAEELAARWPEKYSRVILIASPIDPKPRALKTVLMAGNYDISKERMRTTAAKLGKTATFISLGNAYHGQLGPTPNAVMGSALDFVTAP